METKVIDELLARARLLDPYLGADRERRIAEISLRAGREEVVDAVWYHSEWDKDRRSLILPMEWWEFELKEWGINQ